MDINTIIERKDIDFEIPKNLLLKEVEDKFLEIKNHIISLYPDTPDGYFNFYITLAKINNNNILEPSLAKDIVEILYLNNTEHYKSMITDFYIENIEIITLISKKSDKEEAKKLIYELTSIIKDWIDSYFNKKSKLYEDITWLLEGIEKEKEKNK